ncbi:ribonuclease D [Psychrobium sp. 1_MG-2023]|uniref:ribonuclease D n=1 Tax=Psychrobium sp. 1_MG-2023 TaxID=3062624 RepID=UPI0026A618D0|nr:ribonuclease D [Psychrobium sp. 1_MG-2023]MDP2562195.1 ribonuclease D [Psychrobium sp. 1_MG-2023]
MIDYLYIETEQALADLCQQYARAEFLAIDTEFVRERTYHAALGLIQAYDGETLALIDPVAIDDLSSFWHLLTLPSLTKVIHAGSEDFEVFRHNASVTLTPLFDTQVAAALAGYGVSLGYAKLINEFCNIELDKGESRTNWLARPLSESQLKYAANDVAYLYQVYKPLVSALEEQDKLSLCLEECRRLAEKTNEKPADEKYFDISNAWQLNPQQLAVLKELAQWRQMEAIKRNLAQGFILKDNELFAIAKACPKSGNGLRAIDNIHPMVVKRHGKKIVSIVVAALELDVLPTPLTRLIDYPAYKKTFKAIKGLVEQTAEKSGIPKEIIASKKLIHEVLSYYWKPEFQEKQLPAPVLLTGWRKQLLAEKVLPLIKQ